MCIQSSVRRRQVRASYPQAHRAAGTTWGTPVSYRPVSRSEAHRGRDRAGLEALPAGEDSCRQAPVSDQLTPAIAVLADSFKPEDFVIDCDGCTACCRGHHGVKLDDHEWVLHEGNTQKDHRGEMRLQQVDDACVYLGDDGCTIHGEDHFPRRCREFDCRAAVICYNQVGIDELVAKGELPMSVVEMGRKKLGEFNDAMNVRALSGGGDLSFLMEGSDDAST